MKYLWITLLIFVSTVSTAAPSLDVMVADKQGQRVSLNEFKGKVVYVDFWASWCGPCRKSFPWMEQMHNQYQAQGLAVVAINLDTEPRFAEQFLKDLPASFSILYNPDGDIARQFDLQGMPSSFIFNRAGELVYQHVGFFNKQQKQYEQQLIDLLKE